QGLRRRARRPAPAGAAAGRTGAAGAGARCIGEAARGHLHADRARAVGGRRRDRRGRPAEVHPRRDPRPQRTLHGERLRDLGGHGPLGLQPRRDGADGRREADGRAHGGLSRAARSIRREGGVPGAGKSVLPPVRDVVHEQGARRRPPRLRAGVHRLDRRLPRALRHRRGPPRPRRARGRVEALSDAVRPQHGGRAAAGPHLPRELLEALRGYSSPTLSRIHVG
ncbi:unnamed protein product, partial [Prorocentrum cordatum]